MGSYLALVIDLVIGISLGIWIYLDAKRRDFNPTVWALSAVLTSVFLLSLLGPALIIIVYLIMRPKGKLRKCPHCDKAYLAIYASCPNCRRATKKDCHRCGEAVYVEEDQCPKCKTKL